MARHESSSLPDFPGLRAPSIFPATGIAPDFPFRLLDEVVIGTVERRQGQKEDEELSISTTSRFMPFPGKCHFMPFFLWEK